MVGGAGAHGCGLALWSVAAIAFRAALQRAVTMSLCALRRRTRHVVRRTARVFSQPVVLLVSYTASSRAGFLRYCCCERPLWMLADVYDAIKASTLRLVAVLTSQRFGRGIHLFVGLASS